MYIRTGCTPHKDIQSKFEGQRFLKFSLCSDLPAMCPSMGCILLEGTLFSNSHEDILWFSSIRENPHLSE